MLKVRKNNLTHHYHTILPFIIEKGVLLRWALKSANTPCLFFNFFSSLKIRHTSMSLQANNASVQRSLSIQTKPFFLQVGLSKNAFVVQDRIKYPEREGHTHRFSF